MISKSTKYAVRALVYIQLQNWNAKRPGVSEIAKEIEAPEAYTGKILHTLTKHRLLDSMKGRGGGFFFFDHQPELSLYEIIIVMEGDSSFTKCGFGLKNCSDSQPCPMHDEYTLLREGFLNIAKSETVGSLAKKILNKMAVLNTTLVT
ncbi:MAG: Rrf2 family transcriptional regulator [Deltaproteobacteria bacterium]|nr:Rrf2 family transcriptional regulator [Deltaproteobacteria bacterium]